MYDQKQFLKRYRVYIRPHGEGEYLVFPEGYKNGGKGYIFSEEQVGEIQKESWQAVDFITVCVLFASISVHTLGLGKIFIINIITVIMFLVFYTGGIRVEKRFSLSASNIVPHAKRTDIVMVKRRWQLEFASIFPAWMYLGILVVLLSVFFIQIYSPIFQVSTTKISFFNGLVNGSILAIFNYAHTIWRRAKKAKELGITAGAPIVKMALY